MRVARRIVLCAAGERCDSSLAYLRILSVEATHHVAQRLVSRGSGEHA